jgi:hypothetical protein
MSSQYQGIWLPLIQQTHMSSQYQGIWSPLVQQTHMSLRFRRTWSHSTVTRDPCEAAVPRKWISAYSEISRLWGEFFLCSHFHRHATIVIFYFISLHQALHVSTTTGHPQLLQIFVYIYQTVTFTFTLVCMWFPIDHIPHIGLLKSCVSYQ